MNWLLYRLFPRLRARKKAGEVAVLACKKRFPDELIRGAVTCADEPGRYVVRVFYGNRPIAPVMQPPWRGCLIVAVRKDTYADEVIVDDEQYRPAIR
jgi:hypothetical protein